MKEVKPAAFKTAEAASYLHMSPTKLRELADTGDLPCKKLGRERYFIARELDDWMKRLPNWIEVQSNG